MFGGYRVSAVPDQGVVITTDPDRLGVIKNNPDLTNLKEVWPLLGLINALKSWSSDLSSQISRK